MKTIEQIALEVAQEMGANAMCKDPVGFAAKVNAAWLAQQEPVAWISNESIYRLKHGGNSKGTVPVHLMRSGVSKIPLFLAPPPAVPEGYILVPKEPSEEMCAEGCLKVGALYGHHGARSMYQAMVAAAQWEQP